MKPLFASTLALAVAASAPAVAQSYTSFGLGYTDDDSAVFTLRWHSEPRPAGWSWAAGLYATHRGAAWIGGGVSYTLRPGAGSWFIRGSVMPGLYHRGNGTNLGGPFEIATGIEVGTELRNGAQLSMLLEHRSNAGIYNTNPGLNSLSVLYSIPLN
ncbi:MAG: hypothetical protein Kow0013_18290 [Pararhodobacter sp.]